MFKWLSIYLTTLVLVNPVPFEYCFCRVLSNGIVQCTGTPSNNSPCYQEGSCYPHCYCQHGNKWCTSNGGCIGNTHVCTSDCRRPGRPYWCHESRSCVPSEYQCCKNGKTWCDKKGLCIAKNKPCCSRSNSNCECFDPLEFCPSRQVCLPKYEACCDYEKTWCEKSQSCIPEGQTCKCKEDHYLCNKTDVCMPETQVCENCKTGEIMCTLPSYYKPPHDFSCYSTRYFLDNQHSLRACPSGICRQDTKCDGDLDDCQDETFKCGEQCKPMEDFIYYRTCKGRCIRRNETCTKEDIKDSKSSSVPLIIGLGTVGVIVICIIIAVVIYAIILKKRRKKILYVDQNPVYGEVGDGEYEMNEIMDSNDYYGGDDDDDESE